MPSTTEISIWFPAQQRENKPERILWLKGLVIELNPLPRRSLIQCLMNAQPAFTRNFRCWEMHYLRRCVIPYSDNYNVQIQPKSLAINRVCPSFTTSFKYQSLLLKPTHSPPLSSVENNLPLYNYPKAFSVLLNHFHMPYCSSFHQAN